MATARRSIAVLGYVVDSSTFIHFCLKDKYFDPELKSPTSQNLEDYLKLVEKDVGAEMTMTGDGDYVLIQPRGIVRYDDGSISVLDAFTLWPEVLRIGAVMKWKGLAEAEMGDPAFHSVLELI